MALRNSFFVPSLLVLLSISILQPSEAVINGEKAAPGEFPFTVDIRNGTHPEPFCGGTLVTRRHIVTAVYCVSTIEHLIIDGPPTLLPPENVKVYVGSVGARQGQLYEVEKLFVHPDYNVNVTITWNNIAVIKLKKEVDVKVASFHTVNPTVGQTVTLAGWGYTDSKRKNAPTELRKVTLKVIDTQKCKRKWETLGDDMLVITEHITSNRVFCAEPVVAGSGIGSGDLGSSAVINGQYVGYELLSREDDLTMPVVFSAVAAYKNFIEKAIKS